jgi:adenylosuccinate lyase
MDAWDNDGDFRAAIESDPEIAGLLTQEKLAETFSLERQLKHVDTIFGRVFGPRT